MLKNFFKLTFLVLFVLFSVNALCSLILTIKDFTVKILSNDYRASLPVYSDKKYSKTIFDEFNSLGTSYKSYEGWRRKEFIGKTVHIDSEGLRYDPNHHNKIQDSTNNVYFFGGSTMWGTGVDDMNTIPAIWNSLPNNQNINVFNYGESAYDSRQSLESLINILSLNKKVNTAIFYVGVNEINRCRKIVKTNSHIYEVTFKEKIEQEYSFIKSVFYGNLELIFTKAFKKLKKGDIYDDFQLQCDCDQKKRKEVVNALYLNLKFAKRLVEEQGGKFIAILQPVIYVEKPNKDYLKAFLKNNESENSNYVALYNEIKNTKSKDLELYDFTKIFNTNVNVYIDNCHTNELGNRLIALKIDSLYKNTKQ